MNTALLAATLLSLPLSAGAQEAGTYWAELRDGSILAVSARDQEIPWQTVAADGTVTASTIRLSDIQTLSLAREPASRQVAEIRALVTQLAAEQYHARQQAEEKLLQQGAPFKPIIRMARDHPEFEVRYRVERILDQLGSAEPTTVEFDRLTTTQGRQLDGDIGGWVLQGDAQGHAVSFDRQLLARLNHTFPLSADPRETHSVAERGAVRVQLSTTDESFFADNQVVVNFDEGPDGNAPKENSDVDKFYAFKGSLFSCESSKGYVSNTTFPFKHSRSRNNSIGNYVYDEQADRFDKFKGVMNIAFCLPGRPEYPATVGEAGMFLEIVEARHTIVEAYNSSGQMIGLLETSPKDKSAFVGFSSNEPIARLRVLANHHLQVEDLNRDFAVDDLCFSPPLPDPTLSASKHVVSLDDGQRLTADSVTISDQLVQLSGTAVGEISVAASRVRAVAFAHRRPPEAPDDQVLLMLADRSVLRGHHDSQFRADDFPQLPIEQQVVAFWNSAQPLRFAEPQDMQGRQAVLVFPTYRLALDAFQLAQGHFTADASTAPRLQQNEQAGQSAPSPLEREDGSVQFAWGEAPSVWLRQPQLEDPRRGLVRRVDGQQYVLEGDSGFALGPMGDDSVVIQAGGDRLSIPLAEIQSIRFPVRPHGSAPPAGEAR